MNYHLRNPVKWHGDKPFDRFAIIPNELARDNNLSNYAFRVAIVIRTHAEDYQVSAVSLASDFRWGRASATRALEELTAAGWLAVRKVRTSKGTRAYEEYHVHASRRFTEEELAHYSAEVILPSAYASNEVMSLPSDEARGCTELMHPVAHSGDIKENQQEDQQEHQVEDQPPREKSDCWICEGSGSYSGNPCENCFKPKLAANSETESVADKCPGCRVFGKEGCLTHTTAEIGRRALLSELPGSFDCEAPYGALSCLN